MQFARDEANSSGALMSDIAVLVLAKDEAAKIERCLISVRPYVDRMGVLDTGSTDGTQDIARSCGAEVFQSSWRQDFSLARNTGLALLGADWVLMLDADEWVDENSPVDSLRQAASQLKGAGLICQRNIFDLKGRRELSDAWVPRFVPRGTRYQGRIHEQPLTQGPDQRISFIVHHDGYLKENSEARGRRNIELLRDELLSHPQDAYLHFQMGVQMEAAEAWEDAYAFYKNAWTFGAIDRPFAHDLAVRWLHVLSRIGRFSEAVTECDRFQRRWPQSSDIHFAIGNVALDVAATDPPAAFNVWLPAAEAAWKKCLDIGEDSDEGHHVLGRGSYLAAHNLAVIYEGLGEVERAKPYRSLAEQTRAVIQSANPAQPLFQA